MKPRSRIPDVHEGVDDRGRRADTAIATVGVPQPHEVRHAPQGEDQLRLLLAAGCGSGPRYLKAAVRKVWGTVSHEVMTHGRDRSVGGRRSRRAHRLQSVRQLDEHHVPWMAEVGGRLREWDAEIVEQIPDERIAWRSLDGTPNDGEVRFEPLNPVSEPPVTRVTLTMLYDPNDWVAAVGEALGLANRRAVSYTHLT